MPTSSSPRQARPSHPSPKAKRRRPFILRRSTRSTGSSSPVGRPIRTSTGSGWKGRKSSCSAAASPWPCSKYAAKAGSDLQARPSALAVPRKWIRRFGTARGNTFSSRALPAATRSRWRWPHRCAMRPEDRTRRFFEPGGKAGLAAIRCRQGLHARLHEDTSLYVGDAGG